MRSLADCLKIHGANLDSAYRKSIIKLATENKRSGYEAHQAEMMAVASVIDTVKADGQAIFNQLERVGPVKEKKDDVHTAGQRGKTESERRSAQEQKLESVAAQFGAAGQTEAVVPASKAEKAFQKVAGLFGLDAVFFRTNNDIFKSVGGFMDPNMPSDIFVNTENQKPLEFLVGHETLHQLKVNNEKLYNWLKNEIIIPDKKFRAYVAKHLENWKGSTATEKEISAAIKQDRDYIMEELLADFAGDQFKNPAFWKKMAGKNKSFTQQIIDVINKILDRITRSDTYGTQYIKNFQTSQDALVSAMSAFADSAKITRKDKGYAEGKRTIAKAGDAAVQKDLKFSRQSTRVPKAKSATENALDDLLTVDYDLAINDKANLAKVVTFFKTFPNLRPTRAKDETVAENMVDHMKDNILWVHDQVPEAIRERSRLWYDGANRIAKNFSKKYGISEMQAAGVIATLSPNNEWPQNVSVAERVLDIVSTKQNFKWTSAMAKTFRADNMPGGMSEVKGKKLKDVLSNPKAAAKWVRTYDQTYNDRSRTWLLPEGGTAGKMMTATGVPAKTAWGSYGEIGKAISILMDGRAENIHYQLSWAHKVRNFYNNIYDPASDKFVTIDTHAIGVSFLQSFGGAHPAVKHVFGDSAKSSITGLQGSYVYHAEAYKRAAAERGILPREMQSIVWVGKQALFGRSAKVGSKKGKAIANLWAQHKKGKLTQAEVQAGILEITGGMTEQAWWSEPYNDKFETTYPKEDATIKKLEKFPGKDIRVAFEVAPHPDNAALQTAWAGVTEEQRAEISQTIAAEITPKILKEFSTSGELQLQVGGYEGAGNVGFGLKVENSALTVPIAKMLGYSLSQKEMVVASDKKIPGTDKVDIITISLPEGYSVDKIHKLYYDLYELVDAKGNHLVEGHTTTKDQMAILNFTGLNSNALKTRIKKRLEKFAPDEDFKISVDEGYSALINEREYDYDSYRPRTAEEAAAGSPLLRRPDRFRKEASERLAEELKRAGVKFSKGRDYKVEQSGKERLGRLREGGVQADRAGSQRADVQLTHYGRTKGLQKLDPARHGQGLIGAESRRKAEDPDHWIDRTYYGLPGYKKEPGLGSEKYTASVTADELYDFVKDPDNLKPKAEKIVSATTSGWPPNFINVYEQLISQAGYSGYSVREVAAVFKALEVTPDVKFSKAPPVETKAFRDWFGDSKVVDGDGKPLVVYHGTGSNFTEFDAAKTSVEGPRTSHLGFFFTRDSSVASYHFGDKENGAVMPVYISLKKPLVISERDVFPENFAVSGIGKNEKVRRKAGAQRSKKDLEPFAQLWGYIANIKQKKKKDITPQDVVDVRNMWAEKGFDGLIIKDTVMDAVPSFVGEDWNTHDMYVAFEPTQIKSATGNVGTFDPANPDIRFSKAFTEGTKENRKAAMASARDQYSHEDFFIEDMMKKQKRKRTSFKQPLARKLGGKYNAKVRVPKDIASYVGDFGHRITVGDRSVYFMASSEGGTIYLPNVVVDGKGAGLGKKFMSALKDVADSTGQDISIYKVTNPSFFEKLGWLEKDKFGDFKYTTPEKDWLVGVSELMDIWNSEGQPKFSKSRPEDTQEFKTWSRGYEVLDSSEIADAPTGEGLVFKVYHGTTNGFNIFDPTVKGTKEGQFGQVSYFTSDQSDADMNYAGTGPDLTNRIEQRKELVEDELSNYDEEEIAELAEEYGLEFDPETETYPADLPEAMARAELHGGDPQTKFVFVKADNPAFIGGPQETRIENLDTEQYRDDAIEEVMSEEDVSREVAEEEYSNQIQDKIYEMSAYDEPPLLVAIRDAVRDANATANPNQIYTELELYDPDVAATELEDRLRASEELMYAEDYDDGGYYIQPHVIGQVFKHLGFDAIVLQNANERFRGMDMGGQTAHVHVFAETPQNIKLADDVTYDDTGQAIPPEMRFSESPDIRFSKVSPALVKKLEAGKKIKVYRAMQLIDGKLYPPMSAKVEGKLREPTEIGQWEQAEENPGLADDKGYFKLDKGNKKSIKARYNPYFHASASPLNDQFSSAYDRPNLVTVEVEIPASELSSGYKAEKAKNTVGEQSWNNGPVSSKLPGDKKRTVILSRYAKAVRVVPDSEVAEKIADILKDQNIPIPDNVITPSLRNELQALGVPTTRSKQVAKAEAKAGQLKFSKVQVTAREAEGEGGVTRLKYTNNDGVVVGQARQMGSTIGDIEVKEKFRRQGFGEAMVRDLVERGGTTAIPANEASKALFEKAGFKKAPGENYYRHAPESQLKFSKTATKTPAFKKWFGKSEITNPDGTPQVVYHGTKELFSEFKAGFDDRLSFFSTNPEFASAWAVGRRKKPEDLRNFAWTEKNEKELQDHWAEFHKKSDELYDSDKDEWIKQYDKLKRTSPPRKANVESDADAAVYPVYVRAEKMFNPEKDFKLIEDTLRAIPSMDGIIKEGRHKEGHWIVYENKAVIDKIESLGYDGIWLRESPLEGSPTETIAVWNATQIKSATGNTGAFDPLLSDIRFSKTDPELTKAGQAEIDRIIARLRQYVKKDEMGVSESKTRKLATQYVSLKKKLADRHTSTESKIKEFKSLLMQMPMNVRGKSLAGFNKLASVKNEETKERHFQKLRIQAEKEVNKHFKRETLKAINKMRKLKVKVKGHRKTNIGAPAARVLEYVNQVLMDPKLRSVAGQEEHIAKLKARLEALEGRESTPVIERQILNTKDKIEVAEVFGGYGEATLSDLEHAYTTLETLIMEGRTMWQLAEAERKAMVGEITNKVIQDVTGKENPEPETPAEKRRRESKEDKNTWFKIKRGLSNFDTLHQSWHFLLDKITTRGEGRALHTETVELLGGNVHAATNKESELNQTAVSMIQDKLEELTGLKGRKLEKWIAERSELETEYSITSTDRSGKEKKETIPLSDMQAVYWWAINRRGNALAAEGFDSVNERLELMGVTPEFLKKVETTVDPIVLDLAEWLSDTMGGFIWQNANHVHEARYGASIPNSVDYTPIRADYNVGRSEADLLQRQSRGSSMIKGALHDLTSTKMGVKPANLLDVWTNHINDMNHFTAWAIPVQQLEGVFGNQALRNFIEQHYGKEMNGKIADFIEIFKGSPVGQKDHLSKMAVWRGKFSTAVLGLNPAIYLKQLSSIPAMAADIPIMDWNKGMASFMANPKKAIDILSESQFVKTRRGQGHTRDVAAASAKSIRQLYSGGSSLPTKLMLLVRMGDMQAIYAGGWPVYKYYNDKYTSQGMSKSEAHKKALARFEQTALQTQQTGEKYGMSLIQQGSALQQLFTMFMSAPVSYYREVGAAIRNMKKAPKDSVKRLALFWVVVPALFSAIANAPLAFDDDDEDQELFWKRLARDTSLGPISGLFFVRDIAKYLYNTVFLQEENWSGLGFSSMGQPVETVNKMLRQMVDLAEGEDVSWSDFNEDLIDIAGYTTGLPLPAAQNYVQGVRQIAKGETEHPIAKMMGYTNWATGDKGEDVALTKFAKKKKRVKKIADGLEDAEDKRAYRQEHKEDLRLHGRIGALQPGLNKLRRRINDLKKKDSTEKREALIETLENRRTEMVRRFLEREGNR